MPVSFFNNHISFTLKSKNKIRKWIVSIINTHNCSLGNINYIFVSQAEIISINTKYLSHNYPTDIITFNYNENDLLSGDIFICPEVVNQNAISFNSIPTNELHRVLIHGILHLIGFNDSNEQEQAIMRSMEDEALFELNKL